MALQIWLPLTKDLRNQGLSDVTVTNNGATFNSAGKLGGCYSFGTGDSYITIDSTPLKTFTEFSFACWIKIISWNTSYSTVFAAKNGTGVSWNNLIFSLLRNSSNSTLCFNISNGSSSTTTNCQTGTLSLNTWYHITCTYKSGEIKLYQDGNVVSTYKTVIVPNFNSIVNLWIGKSNANSYQSNNLMNDVRIYDHCLSPMEVKQLSQGLVLHYPLNRGGWGQENFILESHKVISGGNGSGITRTYESDGSMKIVSTSGNGNYASLGFAQNSNTSVGNNMAIGDAYCISCDTKIESGTTLPTLFINSGNSYKQLKPVSGSIITGQWMRVYYTSTWADPGTNYGNISLHLGFSGAIGTYYFKNFKLEKGSIPTPWCPNAADANNMSINGTTEYDTSGYCNNGTKNNIVYTSDTPKYNVSSTFNGTNSYIKVNDNNWMIKGMLAMTINLWAKATTWPTNGGRLVSCTESGGFNLEAGSSGYWRFPIYVYTNSGQTSSAYKYDSTEIKIADLIPDEWNMITLVYDTTGTKTYLNGELHHTYTNTSYGINFNTNARLFLGCEANTASPYAPYFNGMESDFRIYATALSASDVKSLYQNCATIDADGIIHGQIRS